MITSILAGMGMMMFLAAILFILALAIPPLRKTMGLLLAVLGVLGCITGVGIVVGIPMLLVGGLLMFM